MTVTTHLIGSVLAGVGLFAILHIAIWRARPSNTPRVVVLGCLALAGLMVSGWTAVWLGRLTTVELCAVLWIDLFVFIAYFFVYAGMARSVSVTLLSRLRHCHQPIHVETLVTEYARSSRFEDRIGLMNQSGLVQWSGNTVTLTAAGRRLARLTRALSRLITGGLKG